MSILIADDHPLFRDALSRTVGQVLPKVTIHQADSIPALLASVDSHDDLELVLLDLTMPGAEGFSALIHLRSHHPTLPVLVVSARDEPALVRRALAHGASGFVSKSAPAGELGQAITQVLDGERWIPADVQAQLGIPAEWQQTQPPSAAVAPEDMPEDAAAGAPTGAPGEEADGGS